MPANTVASAPEPAPVVAAGTPTPEATAQPVPSPVVTADLSPSLLPAFGGSNDAKVAPAEIAPLVTPQTAPEEAQAEIAPTVPAAPPLVPATVSDTAGAPETVQTPALVVTPETADACTPSLRLAAAPQAMIGVSFVAPCAPNARVVIDHEGLAITAKTNAQGTLFLSVPALAVDAKVSARLAEAAPVEQSVRVPAMATLRRMGVQWHDADAFQLHAFENGAGYDEPGHVSASKPQIPTTGLAGMGGFITVLGDASVTSPMMAEVYTFPSGIAANADIVIESAVTEATCGRELLGETIMTLAGDVYITELTLAMPDCDAVGDILVLKNLLTDLTIAAAN
ncbi:MAG: hypothetical protein ACRCS3_08530 [Paracoccaceae bacterium]